MPAGQGAESAASSRSLRDREIGRVSDLEIALAAGHRADRNVGQVPQHDAAVVRGGNRRESGVGIGQLVGRA